MPTVSYGLKITHENHIFDQTIRVYRAAVNYLVDIALLHYANLAAIEKTEHITAQQLRMKYIEELVHNARNRVAAYPRFDQEFYKFPSYLRRNAIVTAIGKVFAYQSCVDNWKASGKKGSRPFLNRSQDVMPCFYRHNTFEQNGLTVGIKLYDGHDWIWHTVLIRDTDFRYALQNMGNWEAASPVLTRRNRRYELRIAYTCSREKLPQYRKDTDVTAVLGVDLGVNTDAVCSVVRKNGTVTGSRFIDHPVEKDRMYGLLNTIRGAQQRGNRKPPRLWRFVRNYNKAVAIMTASEIVAYARKIGVQVIVFEHLKIPGRIRGSKKQRLALWRKRDIQKRVTELASRYGIRVSYICAVNTSRIAYDGSGKVLRGKEAGFTTNKLCRFQNGKVYNCDLSASRNIAARYFIRVIIKSIPAKELLPVQAKVPELGRRTSCVLATLIRLYAELRTFKTVSAVT